MNRPYTELRTMYPILFQLDGLTIYAYGFFLTLGIVVAGILAILKVRKEGLPISFERVAEGIHLSRSHLHLSRNRNPVGHNLPFYVILFKKTIREIRRWPF